MIKSVYLCKRNPNTSYDEFVENWRRHAALSGSFPEVGKRFDAVVQCRRVLDERAVDLGLVQDFDGANLLGLRSLFDAVDVYNQDGIPTLREDERRVFSDYVSESTMTGTEHVLHGSDGGQVVVLELVRRRPGTDLRSFVQAWTGEHARSVMATDSFRDRVRRYVHNLIVLPTPPGWGYDGIAETWFDSVDDATEHLRSTAESVGGDPGFDTGFATLLEQSHVWHRRRRS